MSRALLQGGHSLRSPRVGAATRLIKCCLLATFFLGVGGCSSGSSAMLDAARILYRGQPASQNSPNFNPNFAYLRAQIANRTIYMVLGYIDQHPEGQVEVWYSGSGEVIRLLNGRLVGSTGLSTDWRATRFSRWPAWPDAFAPSSQDAAPQRYVRERDLMPGYRFGIRDEIIRAPIPAPANSAIAGVDAQSLSWYEERSVTRPSSASLPVARFGLSKKPGAARTVVYSEQCISNDLCMSFERWTPSVPAASTSPSAGE